MSVEVELENIRGRLDNANALWEVHTAQDAQQFEALQEAMTEVGTKLDVLGDKITFNEGKEVGTKRTTIILSGVISLAVSVGSFLVAVNVIN